MEDERIQRIGEVLTERGWKLAILEIATGGKIASAIVSTPGASGWFDRGIVAYSFASKVDSTGLSESTVKENGTVSIAVAEEMASGLLSRAQVQVAIAETSIAPPKRPGARSTKPTGTSCIAVAVGESLCSGQFVFDGEDREMVMNQIADMAITMLLRKLTNGG